MQFNFSNLNFIIFLHHIVKLKLRFLFFCYICLGKNVFTKQIFVDLSTEKDYSQFKSAFHILNFSTENYFIFHGIWCKNREVWLKFFYIKSCKKNDIFNPKYFVKHCIYNPQQSVHQNAQLFLLKKNFYWCIHHR